MSKLKIMIVAAVAAVAMLTAGFITAYAKFDVFKSAKVIYLESELKAFESMSEAFSEQLGEVNEEYLSQLTETSQSHFQLSDLKVEVDEQDEALTAILDLINSFELIVDSQTDPTKNETLMEMELNVDKERLIGYELAVEEERFGFRVKDLLDKYLVLDLTSDAAKEKFGIETQPNRIPSTKEIVDAFKISREDLEPILNAYGRIYAEELKDSQVEMKKDGVFEQGETKIDVREVTVTFKNEDVLNLMDKWLAYMEKDEALFDLIYKKYSDFSKLAEDSGEEFEVMSKNELKGKFTKEINGIRDDIETADNTGDTIKMVLFIDGSDKIIGRQIAIKGESEGEAVEAELEYASWVDQSDEKEQALFAFHADPETGEEVDFRIEYAWNPKKHEGTLLLEGHADSESAFRLKSDFTIEEDGSETLSKIDFGLSISDSGSDLREVLSGSIDSTVEENKNDRSTNQTSKVSLQINDEATGSPVKVSMKLQSEQTFGSEVDMPTYTADNSYDLATMSDTESEELMLELQSAFFTYLEEKEELIGEFLAAFGGALPGMNPPMDELTPEDILLEESFADPEASDYLYEEDIDWEQFEADLQELEELQAELEAMESF